MKKTLGREIIVDYKIFEECCLQSYKTIRSLQVIDGVDDPSYVKTGGVFGYWITKLKPFRVFCLAEFIELCEHFIIKPYTLIPDLVDPCEISDNPKNNFINEIIALIVGASIANNKEKQKIIFKSRKVFHDLIVGLRYRTFSPHAFIMILEAASHPVTDRKSPTDTENSNSQKQE